MQQIIQNGQVHSCEDSMLYQEGLGAPDPRWPADVQAVAAYINKHLFDEGLTVDRVKRECGIGDNNISGRFRYYVGTGIKEYIDGHRINLAKRLLHRNRANILEVSLKVGYPSHSAFTRGFKRHVGCLPSTFRDG